VLYWLTSSFVGVVQQYFTSGWGSLANHLKFLPADSKSKMATATASATAGALDTLSVDTSSSSVAVKRPGFWEVMSPLTDSAHEESGEPAKTSDTKPAQSDDQAHGQDQSNKSSQRRSRRRR
jgi:YidC/Oxa1 family membrane protein insertase